MAKIYKNYQSEIYKNQMFEAMIDFNEVENEEYPETFPIKVYLDLKEGTFGYKYLNDKGEEVGDFIHLNIKK